jgi:large subunit ribosomal protein L25
MKTVSMSGSLRENVGKKDAKKHRKEGKVPCVIYGGKEQIHFFTEEKNFKGIVFTPNVYLIELKIEDKTYTTILKDIQYHPVHDNILHADFLELSADKPVNIAIPISLSGTAPGIITGGRLIKKIRKIKVSALVEDLPDQLVIDISKLKIGDSILVSDVKEDKLSFLENPNSMIVGVFTARTVVEETEEDEEEGEEGEEGTEEDSTEEKAAE